LGDYFGQLFESDKGSPNFSATFFDSKSYALNSAKNGFGYILGDFSTNSSGHPGLVSAALMCQALLALFSSQMKGVGPIQQIKTKQI
jgi:hypothetical protein